MTSVTLAILIVCYIAIALVAFGFLNEIKWPLPLLYAILWPVSIVLALVLFTVLGLLSLGASLGGRQ